MSYIIKHGKTGQDHLKNSDMTIAVLLTNDPKKRALLKAAPELLEACKALQACWDERLWRGPTYDEVRHMVLDAIAKAEGE